MPRQEIDYKSSYENWVAGVSNKNAVVQNQEQAERAGNFAMIEFSSGAQIIGPILQLYGDFIDLANMRAQNAVDTLKLTQAAGEMAANSARDEMLKTQQIDELACGTSAASAAMSLGAFAYSGVKDLSDGKTIKANNDISKNADEATGVMKESIKNPLAQMGDGEAGQANDLHAAARVGLQTTETYERPLETVNDANGVKRSAAVESMEEEEKNAAIELAEGRGSAAQKANDNIRTDMQARTGKIQMFSQFGGSLTQALNSGLKSTYDGELATIKENAAIANTQRGMVDSLKAVDDQMTSQALSAKDTESGVLFSIGQLGTYRG